MAISNKLHEYVNTVEYAIPGLLQGNLIICTYTHIQYHESKATLMSISMISKHKIIIHNSMLVIWRFPKMGVPPNHPFKKDFP